MQCVDSFGKDDIILQISGFAVNGTDSDFRLVWHDKYIMWMLINLWATNEELYPCPMLCILAKKTKKDWHLLNKMYIFT